MTVHRVNSNKSPIEQNINYYVNFYKTLYRGTCKMGATRATEVGRC